MDKEFLGVGRTFILVVLVMVYVGFMQYTGKIHLTSTETIAFLSAMVAAYAGKSVVRTTQEGKIATTRAEQASPVVTSGYQPTNWLVSPESEKPATVGRQPFKGYPNAPVPGASQLPEPPAGSAG